MPDGRQRFPPPQLPAQASATSANANGTLHPRWYVFPSDLLGGPKGGADHRELAARHQDFGHPPPRIVGAGLDGAIGTGRHDRKKVPADGRRRDEFGSAVALAEGHPLLAKLGAVTGAEGNAAYALNAAFMTDGVVLHVTKPVSERMALRFVTTGAEAVSTATRVLVVVEDDAALNLLETHESPNGVAHQPNGVVEFVVGDRAKVAHVRLNANGDQALSLSTITAHLGAEVAFGSRNVVAGSAVSRHQVWMTFAGPDAKGAVRGATMLSGDQHADTTLVVNHETTGCESRELFKHAIDGRGTGVFQGRINVAPGAQKTDGQMMSAAVLLSEEGTMNNKPELEIFADDVQCAHGATCGQLDDDLLFYLMARGLPRPEAEALLIESFLGEAVEEGLDDEVVGEALMGVVEAWLKSRA